MDGQEIGLRWNDLVNVIHSDFLQIYTFKPNWIIRTHSTVHEIVPVWPPGDAKCVWSVLSLMFWRHFADPRFQEQNVWFHWIKKTHTGPPSSYEALKSMPVCICDKLCLSLTEHLILNGMHKSEWPLWFLYTSPHSIFAWSIRLG